MLVGILIAVNILAFRVHGGLDLTAERRFTLTKPTKKLLHGLDQRVIVDIYLTGKGLPAGFQRLRESVRERLQSMRDASGGKLAFTFVDPLEGKGPKELEATQRDFYKKGITAVNVQSGGEEKYSSQIVFPFALVHYAGKEVPVSLLENHIGFSALQKLNYSESLLEYKFAAAINALRRPEKPRIGYITGNGEALGWTTWDALNTLHDIYRLDTVDISQRAHIPIIYDAVIVCKPREAFDDKAKFKLDQYVTRGGHVLMLLDATNTTMDSLANGGEQYLAMGVDLGLDDLLFKWGVRVNPDLIEDLQSNRIPVVAGMVGDQPDIQLKHWFYLPVFTPTSQHPIVNNMDAIMSQYASTIDTVANPEVHKTILLESSQYSRSAMTPTRISLSMLRYPPRPELYNKGFRPAAVLLEGKFKSVFENRLAPDFLRVLSDSMHLPFQPQADSAGAIIVVSDADIFTNIVDPKNGPREMGYWEYDNARYANKSFILNCLEYLTDKSGLLEARNKDVRLRLIDAGRAKSERTRWQAINIVIPVGLLALFASAYLFFRKRRYER